jgi:hypothetical protein
MITKEKLNDFINISVQVCKECLLTDGEYSKEETLVLCEKIKKALKGVVKEINRATLDDPLAMTLTYRSLQSICEELEEDEKIDLKLIENIEALHAAALSNIAVK